MLSAKEIRESFKTFFAEKGHKIVPSAPMVIKGDPTLMFTNAGMNQFKDIVLGIAPIKDPRVADAQKCLRVSGKHNDLEEVGHDTYHHTMFEMLGNWSFGDYFKKEAVEMAWEYLIETLHINPERLYATVFEGSPEEQLSRDDETASYWQKYLPASRILNGNKKDNFWEMGETGPCGPCSEIHLDLRPENERKEKEGALLVNKDHPQVIEVWNLVFMQYNRKADHSLEPLPNHVIDTGMGFERLCMALQGKTSNYDTDLFQPMIQAIASMTGITYGSHPEQDVAMRVIADHIRTIAFSITDGQLPANAKAGYVIRRILRRAVRYGYTFLAQKEPFIYRLLPTLIETMGDAYPELITQQELISKVMKEEEASFLHTLETGIRLLDKKMEQLKAEKKKILSGDDAFLLYDTYGFPLDLTELILREHSMEVNLEEFHAAMQQQKRRARNAATIESGDWVILKEGESRFVGYDLFECETPILRYRSIIQKKSELFQIVLEETPFYAEMGGQVGDVGWLISDTEQLEIIDTKRENNLSVHIVKKLPKEPTALFTAKVNREKRIQCACNHSATHLLHETLREILGKHIEQKGSFVSPEALRFDFSHFQKVSDEEIRTIEQVVNRKIRANQPLVEHRNIPIADAEAMGAMALFGEKYGDEVRVIQFGSSKELCGGTHIPSTGMIGSMQITGESSVAAGVRRIEAVTAERAEELLYRAQDTLRELRAMFNNAPNLVQTVKKSLEENAELKRQQAQQMKQRGITLKKEIKEAAIEKNGIRRYLYQGEEQVDVIKEIAFQLNGETSGKSCFVAGISDSNKSTLMLMLSDELVAEGINASIIVKEAAKQIQGGGGGQPHFATAGGKKREGLQQAIEEMLRAVGVE